MPRPATSADCSPATPDATRAIVKGILQRTGVGQRQQTVGSIGGRSVTRGAHPQQRLPPDREVRGHALTAPSWPVEDAHRQRDVEIAVRVAAFDVAALLHMDVHPQLRVRGVQPRQQRRQVAWPEVVGDGETQVALQRFVAQVPERLVGQREHLSRIADETQAGGGGHDARLAACQQRQADAFLEFSHLSADRRLRQRDPGSRRGQAAFVDHDRQGA